MTGHYEILLANGTVVSADWVEEQVDSGSLTLREAEMGGLTSRPIATLAPHAWLAYRWVSS